MTGSLARFSLNQATIRKASLPEAVRATVDAGIPAIGLWREPVADFGLSRSAELVRDAGLRVSSLCRGGFFTVPEGTDRRRAIDDNRAAIDEARALGTTALVLVVGGLPDGSRDLIGARERVADALAELEPYAAAAGVVLAIEPLHPMYAADRAVVNTLRQANDLAQRFPIASVGVVVDTFHLWYDAELETQIRRAGPRIASYQVCDWMVPIAADPLLSRGYPGEGWIDFGPVTRWVAESGYTGDIECEIFNQAIWDAPYDEVVRRSADAYASVVARHLT